MNCGRWADSITDATAAAATRTARVFSRCVMALSLRQQACACNRQRAAYLRGVVEIRKVDPARAALVRTNLCRPIPDRDVRDLVPARRKRPERPAADADALSREPQPTPPFHHGRQPAVGQSERQRDDAGQDNRSRDVVPY